MHITTPAIVSFHRALTDYYYQSGRHDMPWRQPSKDGTFDPYRILVSEIMLQQTQVDRVTLKYHEFLGLFPDTATLAAAALGDVLRAWNGLGYNRRAKYLWEAADAIQKIHRGTFPRSMEELKKLPGVGSNTAGAIMAYAYNEPVVFIETNIRTVIIHHFFTNKKQVTDAEIRAVLLKLLPETGSDEAAMQAGKLTPRAFYWAMMDYGTYLKKSVGNLNRSSTSYNKQPAFEGSKRQIRGAVIRLLGQHPQDIAALQVHIVDDRLTEVLDDLQKDGLIKKDSSKYRLS